MAIKAGDWATLWERMGDAAPCYDWQRYLETFSCVSEAMQGIRKQEPRGEYGEATIVGGTIVGRFFGGWAGYDAGVARSWLWMLLGVPEGEARSRQRLPTTRQVLDALARYEDPS